MSDAAFFGTSAAPAARTDSQQMRLPAPYPVAAPVFLNDCVTPLAGETLLSLLMKRMMPEDQP